jgi:hypothetical protein
MRGCSKSYQPIPRCETDYNDCSPEAKRNRIELEKCITHQLTNSTNEQNRENRISFLTDLINSDKENFYAAIEQSHFRTQSFKLTTDQTIELKNKINLTWSQQRLLRSYLHSLNRNILPPEKEIRKQQLEYHYEFEADSIKINNDLITYVRVSDCIILIEQQLDALRSDNQLTSHDNLIPNNEIWLNILGDK